jgi:signal transduction histidine kinase
MSRAWILTAAAGVLVAVADVVVGALWPTPIPAADVALNVAVGLAWVGAGLVAWARRPELRIGQLMCAVGFAWWAQDPWWLSTVPLTIGLLLANLALPVVLHAVMAFPDGRLDGRRRTLVIAAYALVLGGNLISTLVWDPRLHGCPQCGANFLLIHPAPAVERVLDVVVPVIGVVIGSAVVAELARRWRSASPVGRAVLGPMLWTAVLGATITVARMTADAVGDAPAWMYRASWVALAVVPLAFLAGAVRARVRRGAMTTLMVELAELPPPAQVRDALARALGDASLRLLFWIGGRYTDLDGSPAVPRGAVTVLEYGGERFAALEHDPFLYDDRELLEAVGAAARLAVENSRLQAQLRAQLAEVHASRARIVAADDAERRRLERDLHDGAQQRLLGIRLALRLARSRVGTDDAEVEELLGEADDELMAGLAELRALARGIHPAVLTDEGLAAALGSLARRATVPVEIRAVPQERLAGPVEAAAYFVASEALANVAKHAQASSVTIAVTRDDGWVRLEVADDGIGGADVTRGSGLAGLRDRVEALDGHLDIKSRATAGTTLSAEFPCA